MPVTPNKKAKVGLHFYTSVAVILLVAFSRVIPHPVNFTPAVALALFSGMHFREKKWALTIPILAMALSDLVLFMVRGGPVFFALHLAIYLSLTAIAAVGLRLRGRWQVRNFFGVVLASTLLFFFVINTTDWLLNLCGEYPKTIQSFVSYQIDALPVLQNMLWSGWLCGGVLIGLSKFVTRYLPAQTAKQGL